MSPRFHTILFDLDGTLIDSTALILKTFRETAHTVGREPPPDEELMKVFGIPLREALAMLTDDRGQLDHLLETYTRIHDKYHDDMVRPFDGVVEALEAVEAAGIRRAIVTGKRGKYAQQGLDVTGLARFFDVLISPESTTRHKPDPDPLQEALRQLGSEVEGAAYIGDSAMDVKAGLACGVATYAVRWGPVPDDLLEAAGAKLWLETPADFLTLL